MIGTFHAETKHTRNGTHVTRHWNPDEAIEATVRREQIARETVNPVVSTAVKHWTPSVEAFGTFRSLDVSCPICGDDVAPSLGIHFDCRDSARQIGDRWYPLG